MCSELIESVYTYIEQSAHPEDGGVSWPAFEGPNAREEKLPGLYKGAAGIAYFLIDYYQKTGRESALNLAQSGLSWALKQKDTKVIDLGAGWAGVGTAYLNLASASPDSDALQIASEIGDQILTYDPGPVLQYPDRKDDRATDIFRGAAGQGLFLLRLYSVIKEQRYLQGAIRNAEWLSDVAIRDNEGCHWTIYTSLMSEPPPTNRYLGFCHGASGIGYFLVQAYHQTPDANIAALINDVILFFQDQAIKVPGGLNWPFQINDGNANRFQWCHGSPGIGLFLISASDVLQSSQCLRMALAAGEAAYKFKDGRNSPIQCHGLSGNAELFLEIYKSTKDKRWLDRANEFALMLNKYRVSDKSGDMWQSDEPKLTSATYSCGAAGIGHFLLRLDEPNRFQMPFA